MHKSPVNKQNIIHWSSIGNDFKAYYTVDDKIYELKIELPLHVNSDENAIEWIIKLESKNFSNEVTIQELLNDEDKIMIDTKLFKERVKPLIQKDRDKKIKTIINGD